LNGGHVSAAALHGLGVLRAWLGERFVALERTRMRKPDWFLMLSLHVDLLSARPCDRYAEALLSGYDAMLQLAVDDLAIPSESWVMEAAVMVAAHAPHGKRHDDFMRRGEGCLLDLDAPLMIMRLNDFVAVEYAAKGRDLMLFRWDSLAAALMRIPIPGMWGMGFIHSAKIEASLAHRDCPEKELSWERTFDDRIRIFIRQGL